MKPSTKFVIIISTIFLLLISIPLLAQASPLAYPTERLAGQDRIGTALKIAQKGWDSAQTVILCEQSDYPDSIAATPFAVSLNAPILLTSGASLDTQVVSELQRLKPQKIILLGGAACLQPQIEKDLAKLSLSWERIGGFDRYETSTLLATRLTSDSLILVNGDNFPDALSAATYAGIKQIPIVLTSTHLPDSVIQYYQAVHPKHLIVIGGEAVVPPSELAKHNFMIETRLGGQDRYETNAKVISYVKDTYSSNDLFLASGITFPDAVAGTVLASKDKSPLMLTEKDDIPPAVYTLMREHMKVAPLSNSTSNNDSSQNGTIVASGGLNLRNTPSTSGKILTIVPQGTTITILDRLDNWYKTAYQSNTGWVSANYVTLVSPSVSTVDLSQNGTIYILGGTGIISSITQNIIEGKAASQYSDNQKAFPTLPTTIQRPNSPSRGGVVTTPTTPTAPTAPTASTTPTTSVSTTYDPSTKAPLDPLAGIPTNALAGKTIMIDSGHGGPDTGALGPNHTLEKNNTLAISLALNNILTQAGAKVILTRNSDVSPAKNYTEIADLKARVTLANHYKPDLFICIHNNSFTNPDVQGTSTYYSGDNPKANESLQLANSIQSAIVDTVKTNNRGVRSANFYVLRNTTMPAILLEAAFISNPYEEARLQNPVFQKNLSAAIFHGIYNYYLNPLSQN